MNASYQYFEKMTFQRDSCYVTAPILLFAQLVAQLRGGFTVTGIRIELQFRLNSFRFFREQKGLNYICLDESRLIYISFRTEFFNYRTLDPKRNVDLEFM